MSNNYDTEELVDSDSNKNLEKCRIFMGSRLFRGLLFVVFFSIIIPPLLYFLLLELPHSDEESDSTCLVTFSYRVPCGKPNLTENVCHSVKCCFDEETEECYHSIPSAYKYQYLNDSGNSRAVYTALQSNTPFGSASVEQLSVSVVEIDENRVKIVVHKPDVSFEETTVTGNKSYSVILYQDNLYVDIQRTTTNDTVFTTTKGPLIASDGFWEWSFQLTTEKMFGLGDITFPENSTYKKVIYKNRADHNTLPAFLAIQNGSYHGAIVEHDGPLEVAVLPSQLVVLRGLVGEYFGVVVSMGPTPKEVLVQQRQVEYYTIPSYWTLGAHICRTGSTTMASILEEYAQFSTDTSVQYASDCIHDNLLLLLNETYLVEVQELISKIQENSGFFLSIPPQIEIDISESSIYNQAVELDVLYKKNSGETFNGSYYGKQVAFPDFTHPSVREFYSRFIENLPTHNIDGIVLIDNWPGEDSFEMNQNGSFPHLSEELTSAMSKTLQWNASGYSNTSHIFHHNSYGSAMIGFFRNFTDVFLMTASADNAVADAVHVQNVEASWSAFHRAIKTVLAQGLFGTPLVSVPVCGSTDAYDPETHEVLCMRWYIMAATMPIFRIASDLPRRHPEALATATATNVAIDAIKKRQQLSLYINTVLNGREPLMRPMFYDFPGDNETLHLDQQYMVGSALLVAHPVVVDASRIWVYLPPGAAVWYEFWGGRKYTELGLMQYNIVDRDWINFVAGGSIIPLRNEASESSPASLTLAVALNCSSAAAGCAASGTLYFGPAAMQLTADETGVTLGNLLNATRDMGCEVGDEAWPTYLQNLRIYGLDGEQYVTSNFTAVDLCGLGVDEYFVSYFV